MPFLEQINPELDPRVQCKNWTQDIHTIFQANTRCDKPVGCSEGFVLATARRAAHGANISGHLNRGAGEGGM